MNRRDVVRIKNAIIPTNEPRYLEPFQLMRWFGEAYWDLFLNAALVAGRQYLAAIDRESCLRANKSG